MLEGFDLGNSPVAVTPERVAGKRLFMSTTNGTRALDRVREVPLLLTAALPNREAVSQRLLAKQPTHVAIVGSGWEGNLERNALYTYNRQLGLWRISPDSFPATEGVVVSPWPNSVVSPMVKMGFTWLVWFIGPIVTNGH